MEGDGAFAPEASGVCGETPLPWVFRFAGIRVIRGSLPNCGFAALRETPKPEPLRDKSLSTGRFGKNRTSPSPSPHLVRSDLRPRKSATAPGPPPWQSGLGPTLSNI